MIPPVIQCDNCGGPVFKPGFAYCLWCSAYLEEIPVCFLTPPRNGTTPVQSIAPGHSAAVEYKGGKSDLQCPACHAPLLMRIFQYCVGCGGEIPSDLREAAKWKRKVLDLEDERLARVLLNGVR